MQFRQLARFTVPLLAASTSCGSLHGQLPSGLLGDFRFAGFVHNGVRPTLGLEAKSALFTADRFGNTREALLTTGSGLVGSKSADFLKNRVAWTWAAWIRPDKIPNTDPGNLYSEGNGGLSGHISVFQGKILVQLWNELATPNWGTVSTGPVLSIGTWSHVAVTFDGQVGSNLGTCSIYLDGTLVQSAQLPYLRATGALGSQHQFAIGMNVGFYVGGQTFAPYRYDGAIDEMRIFDRALSPSEVSGLLRIDDRLGISPAIELHFQTAPGQNYRLQWSTDLKNWTDYGEVVSGTGSEFSAPVSIRSAEERFWRLDPIP